MVYQAVFPNAKRVDLNMLLAYDKVKNHSSMLSAQLYFTCIAKHNFLIPFFFS